MGYIKFINVGIERQQNSVTIDEATRNYARSCEWCAKKGYNFEYDCDYSCPITIAHRDKLDTILTLRQIEHQKMVRKNEELRKCVSLIEAIYYAAYCPNDIDKHNDEIDSLTDKWLEIKGNGVK